MDPGLVRRVLRVSPELQEDLIAISERLFDETRLEYSHAAIIRGLIALGIASIAGKVRLAVEFAGSRVPRGRKRRTERSLGLLSGPMEAIRNCEHRNTVSVVERGSARRKRTPPTICRTCHAIKRDLTGRWTQQSAAPAVGAAMMPIVPADCIPAGCCIIPYFDSAYAPPFLVPTVPAAFEPDLVVGQRATFLVSYQRRQWISAKVVWVGEDESGERGYVALTEQGVTLRGWKAVYPRSSGVESFWSVTFYGPEDDLAASVAAHRAICPRELTARPPSRA